jgi:hypothetical protein
MKKKGVKSRNEVAKQKSITKKTLIFGLQQEKEKPMKVRARELVIAHKLK